MSTTIAALPNVAAAEFLYMEMIFPDTFEPILSSEFKGRVP